MISRYRMEWWSLSLKEPENEGGNWMDEWSFSSPIT